MLSKTGLGGDGSTELGSQGLVQGHISDRHLDPLCQRHLTAGHEGDPPAVI